MITGAHVILNSTLAGSIRGFFRDVLELDSIDAGGGWLIFSLPPAEVAVHPAEKSSHELYLMCDDVQRFIKEITAKGFECSPVHEAEWGALTQVSLPDGTKLGVYQPTHPSPATAPTPRKPKKASAPKKKKAKTKVKASARLRRGAA